MTCAFLSPNRAMRCTCWKRTRTWGETSPEKFTITLEGFDVPAMCVIWSKRCIAPPDPCLYRGDDHPRRVVYIGSFVTRVKSDRGNHRHQARRCCDRHRRRGLSTHRIPYGEDERVLTHLELEEQIARAMPGAEFPEPGDDSVRRLLGTKTGTTAAGYAAASPSSTP